MRGVQVDSLQDVCNIGTRSTTARVGYNPRSGGAWAYSTEATACGVGESTSDEVNDGSGATLMDVKIRFGLATSVDGHNRIKVIERHGTALASPEYFAILGDPWRGPTGFVANSKRLIGNAAK